MMKVKIAIAVIVWLLVGKSEVVNLWVIIGIVFIIIALTIIQFSIKAK